MTEPTPTPKTPKPPKQSTLLARCLDIAKANPTISGEMAEALDRCGPKIADDAEDDFALAQAEAERILKEARAMRDFADAAQYLEGPHRAMLAAGIDAMAKAEPKP